MRTYFENENDCKNCLYCNGHYGKETCYKGHVLANNIEDVNYDDYYVWRKEQDSCGDYLYINDASDEALESIYGKPETDKYCI